VDLLASGDVEVRGLSVESPEDDRGRVESVRAVAAIGNVSGGELQCVEATVAFRDGGGSVLESAGAAVVGLPDDANWALVAEYGGDDPDAVATVEVTGVRGVVDAELEDWRGTGAVELSTLSAARGARAG
jgi:hypothetical protein